MVFFALSLQDQVDKYSSYVGVAAFLGLAALSLLYFSQARELKRLRDWAGRAPERARELEDRVAAQAETTRRAPTTTPRPQPVAAATAAGARSGAVSSAGPVAAAKAPTALLTPAAEDGEKADADEALDLAPEPAASAPGRKEQAAAALAAAKVAGEQVDGDKAAAKGEPEGDEAAAKGEPDEDGSAAKAEPDSDGAAAKDEPDGDGAAAKDEPAPAPAANVAGNGAPASPQPAPFLRPGTAAGAAAAGGGAAAASGSAPRPAAMPARASSPSATVPPRRPVTLPSRRPAPPPSLPSPREPERRSRTSIAAVGGVIAVLLAAGAFVATQVLGGDEDPAKPDQANTPTPSATGAGTSTPAAGTPLAKADTTVAVFNGTTVGGLAAQTADGVESSGFKRGRTGDYTDQQLASSVLFYTRPARTQARAIGRQLSIANLKAIDSETQALAGEDADVVVVIGFDKAP